MVKKLFKHEFIAYMRALLPMHLILLGVACLTRFVYFFEEETTIFNIIGTSSIIALVVASVVCLVMTFFNVITRFYKNMFTNEGYLSFTLPVTVDQHILVKVITGCLFIIFSLIFIVVAVLTASAGVLAVELIKAGVYLLKFLAEQIGSGFAGYVVEAIILALVTVISGILLFYACIALGQLSNKNRKIAAIGVYFGYYFVFQIFGTIMIILFSELQGSPLFISIVNFIDTHPKATIHIGFWIGIVWTAILGLVYYAITRYIMKNKLNLE